MYAEVPVAAETLDLSPAALSWGELPALRFVELARHSPAVEPTDIHVAADCVASVARTVAKPTSAVADAYRTVVATFVLTAESDSTFGLDCVMPNLAENLIH